MLHLSGTLRAAQEVGGGVNRKTGEAIPVRCVLQIEDLDDRGLVDLHTITVPDLKPYRDCVGGQVSVPVRAWAVGTPVQFSHPK
jgi:hypothetical protein